MGTDISSGSALAEDPAKILKTIRSNAEIENFYRFVSDNSLRREAKLILEDVYRHLAKKKKRKKRTPKAKKLLQ